jgi:hypothetical protein
VNRKKNEPEENSYLVTLELNARLQPLHRGHFYEDPIGEALEAYGCGVIDGGGTVMQESGEVALCDVEIALNENTKENIDAILHIIDEIAVPKGSFLRAEGLEVPVGKLEGLALYLNGTELPDEVYRNCDMNYVVKKINELLAQSGSMYSFWQGSEDTALYFYGLSFDIMKEKMESFLLEYPLCQKCRIEQIA